MTLPTNDVLPTHDDLANRELSIEELEAIAAGFSWRGLINWIKGEVNDHVHAGVVAAGGLLGGTRDLLHEIF